MQREQREALKHLVSEAIKARLEPLLDACTECGADRPNQTVGCKACMSRAFKAGRATCQGCGTHHSNRTIGCKQCQWRHQSRRKALA